jgi:DNA-binding GntR family transcriptional regulator
MDMVAHLSAALKRDLHSGIWPQGNRLPSLAELAGQYQVSRTTVWRAIGRLKNEGLVYTRKNGMIFSGPVVSPKPEYARAVFAWERFKNRLGADILAGAFDQKRLPAISKLSLRYGIAINTLKKALAGLIRDGLLVREGSGYAVARSRARGHQPAIVLIGNGDARTGLDASHVLTQRIIESFERECLRLHYRSQTVAFDVASADCLLEFTAESGRNSSVAGYIITLSDLWEPARRQRWIDLLGFLAKGAVPVVVIDHAGSLLLPPALTRAKNLRVFQIAGVRAGEIMADFLIRRGYDRAAFVTSSWNHDWAQKRFQGLRRRFQQYGGAKSRVELFADKGEPIQGELGWALLAPTNQEFRTLFRNRYVRTEMEAAVRDLETIRKNPAASRLSDSGPAQTIKRVARLLAGVARQKHEPETYAFFLNQVVQYANTRGQEIHQAPLFQEVLTNFSGNLWVCSEDRTAKNALLFLGQHHRRVPGDISIVGFDNWPEAYEHHITSFDFNMNGMVELALLVIVDPKRLRETPALSEIDGYVVERRTTRR